MELGSAMKIRKFKGTVLSKMSIYGKISIFILLVILITGALYFLSGSDSHRIPTGSSLEPPSLKHFLGTDDLGIDILAQILYGAGISILIGVSSGLLAGLGGSILGVLAGYYGGKIDKILMGLCDIFMTLPHMPMILVLGMFFGSGIGNIILVISLLSWVRPAKIARSKVLLVKEERFIILARNYGAGFFHLLTKHFIPLIFPILMVSIIKIISHGIMAEAGIAFLGLGDPTVKSWGMMLNRGLNFSGIYFTPFWKWWVLSPLLCLISLILAISFISRGMEKIINEKL